MSTGGEILSAAAQALQVAVAEMGEEVRRWCDFAAELAETAHQHGWHGIGAPVGEACELLDAVSGELLSAEQATRAAGGVLGRVSGQRNADGLAHEFTTAGEELDGAIAAADRAAVGIEEAIAACAAVGQESLCGGLQALRDDSDTIHELAAQLRADMGAAGEGVRSWADGGTQIDEPDGTTPGPDSERSDGDLPAAVPDTDRLGTSMPTTPAAQATEPNGIHDAPAPDQEQRSSPPQRRVTAAVVRSAT